MNWEESVEWLRSQPDKRDSVLASYYDDPLIEAARRYYASDEWSAIALHLPKDRGMRALDVGAGRGIASFALAKSGFEVTALEPDGSALVGAQAIRQLAREANLNIDVVQEASERLPFGDCTFDVVFGRAVLHHTRNLSAACAEFHRVLRPGGVFMAVREHVITRAEDLEAFLRAHELHFLYGGENAFKLDHYLESIEKAGFVLDAVIRPLQSPINFAPHTEKSLQLELAKRASFGSSQFAKVLAGALAFPGCWPFARLVLERVDNRPGRLFSFVAHRSE